MGRGELTPGRWPDFVLHVKWSTDARPGFVELWFDGTPTPTVEVMVLDAAYESDEDR